jgi:hypothetical protein
MTNKSYLLINEQTNVCENSIIWDGNPETWTPPANYLILEQSPIKMKVWMWNSETKDYELQIVDSGMQFGFIWDGTYLVTNESKPVIVQPESTGTQTL